MVSSGSLSHYPTPVRRVDVEMGSNAGGRGVIHRLNRFRRWGFWAWEGWKRRFCGIVVEIAWRWFGYRARLGWAELRLHLWCASCGSRRTGGVGAVLSNRMRDALDWISGPVGWAEFRLHLWYAICGSANRWRARGAVLD
ncbi:MAG: hypothetical protein JWM04_1558 [Verrucomicrobiales bacterium]|nr:hypothetical protein [Verrucomicrobiales bacterium]